MRELDLGWLAALFEGEGSIYIRRQNRTVNLHVGMTDEDVVRKFHSLSGIGHVNGPYFKSQHKPVWVWKTARRSDVYKFLSIVRPHMGFRRQAKIDEALEYLSTLPVSTRRFYVSKPRLRRAA